MVVLIYCKKKIYHKHSQPHNSCNIYKIIIPYNIGFHFLENQIKYLCFFMYPEGAAKCMALVTATFNLSTEAATDVSLYSEDKA
jgi:hypothetical protein